MEFNNKFRSLWHICLYGVGQLRSEWAYGNKFDNLWLLAASELQNRFNARSPVIFVNLETIQGDANLTPSAINEILRYYYFSLAADDLNPLYNFIKFQSHRIMKWSDRCKYELLATCSMFISSKKFRETEPNIRFRLIEELTIILLSIADPFLYARLANLLFVDLDQTIELRAKEEIFEQSLNKVFYKFEKNMPFMSLKEPDEAHSINAFYVFSACLLGDAIARLQEDAFYKASQMNKLKNVADHHFTLLAVDHKASQYTFYKMFLTHFNNNYEVDLNRTLSEISIAYTEGDFKTSPLAYLRSCYLLMEYSQLQKGRRDTIVDVLSNNIISRLTKISSSHLTVKDKYDNDILCFCYAYILSCLDFNSELRKHVVAAAESISSNIKSIPNSDLYKLLNCQSVVKHS